MAQGQNRLAGGGATPGDDPVQFSVRHTIEFVWPLAHEGRGWVSGADVVGLFSEALIASGCRTGLETVLLPDKVCRRILVNRPRWQPSASSPAQSGINSPLAPAAQARLCATVVVAFGAQRPLGRHILHVADIPWQDHGLPQVAGCHGEALVALGVLTWMYGQDPALVRRLLERRIAGRGRTVIGAALRWYEWGWRLAPTWAPFRCVAPSSPPDGRTRSPKPDADSPLKPPSDRARPSPMNCRAFAPAMLENDDVLLSGPSERADDLIPHSSMGRGTEGPSEDARAAVRRLLLKLGIPEVRQGPPSEE